jgi:hypothetical protein
MDRLDALNESRAKIYEDIKRLISPALGADVDFDEEVKALHLVWSESPDSTRLDPKTPLQVLLLEYDRVCSEIEPIRVDAELTRIEETATSIRKQIQALVASIEPSYWTRNAAIHQVLAAVLSTPEILEWLSRPSVPERVRLGAGVRDWIAAEEDLSDPTWTNCR